jgi:hypothetical protein
VGNGAEPEDGVKRCKWRDGRFSAFGEGNSKVLEGGEEVAESPDLKWWVVRKVGV